MQSLKAVLEAKKAEYQQAVSAAGAGNGAQRWVRKGDLARGTTAPTAAATAVKRQADAAPAAGGGEVEPRPSQRLVEYTVNTVTETKEAAGGSSGGGATGGAASSTKLPVELVIKSLRGYGQPVTLFGELDADREIRLRHFEASLESTARDADLRLGAGHEIGVELQKSSKRQRTEETSEELSLGRDIPTSVTEIVLTKDVDDQTYIYKFFKILLKMWEIDLARRPEVVKTSAAGKAAAGACKQCKDYMKPFFKMCKNHEVPPDICKHVREMVRCMEQLEYVKANDSYLDLAVGNAPWPIGVTSVGIHERAARTKIFANNIAHVLNDECQRKYITSIKRLITYCQTKFPTVPSKMIQ